MDGLNSLRTVKLIRNKEMNEYFPTSDLELNTVLHEFVTGVQRHLGDNFISAFLQGSFAVGDWDADSDVDFLIAIEHEVSDVELSALQTMHARIYNLESNWAKHLEGSYFPKEILKRNDPGKRELWYLDNIQDKLIRSDHDNSLVVRWVVREYGISLTGRDARELIDPVSADELRQEVRITMQDWAEDIFTGRWSMNNKWAQPFAVLSYCRMLHTLQTGRIGSKQAGAQWAKKTLDQRWTGLIEHSLEERPNPSFKVRQLADPAEVNGTLEFIHYALELNQP
jgi:predicted nucleotidyltransferase